MGIKMVTKLSDIDRLLKKSFEIIEKEMFTALAKLGEESVVRIRDRSQDESWYDHTSNLRSSIGYAIYDYGQKKLQSTFEAVGGGSLGSSEGKKAIRELAQQYSDTFALVVIAAMNYAEYVEAIESKDVLASTELWAKSVVDERLERAKQEAIKKINNLQV
jgi:isopentenyl diphosphate isomerase/L-lactate dehydrogenase-like FMN-dependent dehydrogenase